MREIQGIGILLACAPSLFFAGPAAALSPECQEDEDGSVCVPEETEPQTFSTVECTEDADCSPGSHCEYYGVGGGCAYTEVGELAEPCPNYTYQVCVADSCQSDEDCPPELMCGHDSFSEEQRCVPRDDAPMIASQIEKVVEVPAKTPESFSPESLEFSASAKGSWSCQVSDSSPASPKPFVPLLVLAALLALWRRRERPDVSRPGRSRP